MPRLALSLLAALVVIAVVARLARHRRRHGASAFVALRPGGSPWERVSGALLAAGLLLLIGAWGSWSTGSTGVAFTPPMPPILAGLAVWLCGLGYAWRAQEAMGAAFRMGVDLAAAPALVTAGPFARVRNPIYTGLLGSIAGLLAVAPHAAAALGWLCLAAAFRLQVVCVEEPFLARQHGRAWTDYAARTGRFLPWYGRLPTC